MPVMYVVFKNLLHCTGCLTSIENALYMNGAKHFEYDQAKKIGKIVYEEKDTDEVHLVDAIKHIGYDLDVIELNEEKEDVE